ncbi:MAG: NAD-binding protein, partial [Candidatus Krumholzibacteria bacterium]|nr:NAD-binding protein [Candidatus Krumholzibacteria bacterium]
MVKDPLDKKGQPFVVIDKAPEVFSTATELGYVHIVGDSMAEEILQEAQIEKARGMASCLPEDADNVFVILTARDLAPDVPIVSKANYERGAERIRRAGANHVLS